jgi:hypothetical protein
MLKYITMNNRDNNTNLTDEELQNIEFVKYLFQTNKSFNFISDCDNELKKLSKKLDIPRDSFNQYFIDNFSVYARLSYRIKFFDHNLIELLYYTDDVNISIKKVYDTDFVKLIGNVNINGGIYLPNYFEISSDNTGITSLSPNIFICYEHLTFWFKGNQINPAHSKSKEYNSKYIIKHYLFGENHNHNDDDFFSNIAKIDESSDRIKLVRSAA